MPRQQVGWDWVGIRVRVGVGTGISLHVSGVSVSMVYLTKYVCPIFIVVSYVDTDAVCLPAWLCAHVFTRTHAVTRALSYIAHPLHLSSSS